MRPERESKGWKILTQETWEPALESCMKMQRSTGDNGKMSKRQGGNAVRGPSKEACVGRFLLVRLAACILVYFCRREKY